MMHSDGSGALVAVTQSAPAVWCRAGNLPPGIVEREIEDEFARFGRVRSLWVARWGALGAGRVGHCPQPDRGPFVVHHGLTAACRPHLLWPQEAAWLW
jgi:hypothetical protein